ncbi:MAG: serine O-acetyltransferase EpsC [Flavobacterium sp.]
MIHPIYKANCRKAGRLPDKAAIEKWLQDYFNWMFCIGTDYDDYEHFVSTEKGLLSSLEEQLNLTDLPYYEIESTVLFIKDYFIPLHHTLEDDLKAIFEFDPAAKLRDEVLLTYPGFFAIAVYRLAHKLWTLGVPIIPRMMAEYVHSRTGIDIHPGAVIGERFFIDHGTGIVIGETAIIGNGVKMYQGVTLGALSVSKAEADVKRHPTIGNEVTIYANATILGGKTTIGDGAVIGGNVWITGPVPAHALVYHKSEAAVKQRDDFPEPLNFVI